MSRFDTYLKGDGLFGVIYGEPMTGKSSIVGQLLSHNDPITGRPYRLYVADLDRQLHVIRNQWGSSKPRPAEERERIWPIRIGNLVTLDANTGAGYPATTTQGWMKLVQLTQRWGEGTDRAEPYADWESDRVVFIDGGSKLVQLGFHQVLGARSKGMWTSGSEPRLVIKDQGDYGNTATVLEDLIASFFSQSPRRFHVIFSFHCAPLTVNLAMNMDEDELKAASRDPKKAEALKKAKKSGEMSVKTTKQYLQVAGAAQARRIFGSFLYVLPVVKKGEPVVLTQPTPEYDVRIPGQLGKFPAGYLSGSNALAEILKLHHETEKEKND